MDARLVAWARAVKARRRHARPPAPPPLWLFTEPSRMPDLAAAVMGLPPGLCGVVFRHDGVAGRRESLRRLARLCRARRLALVVAGAERDLPWGAGRHLRGGRGPASTASRSRTWLTSSVHDKTELIRARRAGADAVFVSPAFPTASHPGARALGPMRWAALARGSALTKRVSCFALGGVDGRAARRLPAWIAGAGAIGALLG